MTSMTKTDSIKGLTVEENRRLKFVDFYNKDGLCLGDFEIVDGDIYEVRNPLWLSDTFIFCYKHFDDVFLAGDVDATLYIKVNANNKIEEIGTDFVNRFNSSIKKEDIKEASEIHKVIFSAIGDEYWLKTYKRENP